jgi:pimeloyl-ACP methyl ester carboxylesterase
MSGELCRFRTPDRMELHGILCKSEVSGVKGEEAKRTAVVHVHGWEGNFYENRFIYAAARAATRHGFGFFAFNNRGHDYIADILRTSQGSRVRSQRSRLGKRARNDYVQIGGMYERLGDCVPDIKGALAFLEGRGFRRFVLQGHSHGAIKVTHYLHKTQDPRVVGLALLSPSDDLGWGRATMGPDYARALALARRLVRQGKARQPMPEGLFPYPTSAGAFLDSFAPESITASFNLSRTDRREFPELAGIGVPVFIAVGTVEEAFCGDPACFVKHVAMQLESAPSVEAYVIEGASHNYLGREEELGRALNLWLSRRAADGGRQRPKVKSQESTPRTRKGRG